MDSLARERERCAKIADEIFYRYTEKHGESVIKGDGLHEAWSVGMACASKIAEAIRAIT
jgi:hypothetical protein